MRKLTRLWAILWMSLMIPVACPLAGTAAAATAPPPFGASLLSSWGLEVAGTGNSVPTGLITPGGQVEGQIFTRPGSGANFGLSDLLGILLFSRGAGDGGLSSWFLFMAFQGPGNPAQFFWGRFTGGTGPGNGTCTTCPGNDITVPEPPEVILLMLLMGLGHLVASRQRSWPMMTYIE